MACLGMWVGGGIDAGHRVFDVSSCTFVHNHPWKNWHAIFFFGSVRGRRIHVPWVQLAISRQYTSLFRNIFGLGRFACDSCLLFMMVSETIAKSVTWHDTVMIIVHATIIGCVRIPCVGHGGVAAIARFVM